MNSKNKQNIINNAQIKKNNMKEIRKNQYQRINQLNSINNDNSTLGKLGTSEIKLDQFLESRKLELNNFMKILGSKTSTKSGHQLLPKHMRRRAMSHNPFRVTVRRRVNNFNSDSTSKCRKHKRKKKQLVKSWNRRRVNSGWLETHIWHAKRFFMKEKFGCKLAFKRTDKSVKAIIKFAKYSNVLYDKSYYKSLLVDFHDEKILKVFLESIFLSKFNSPSLINKKPNSFIDGQYLLYSNDYKLIGPIEVIKINDDHSESEFKYMFSYHPLMNDEIIKVFDHFNTKIKEEKDLVVNDIIKNIKISLKKRVNCFEIHGDTKPLYNLLVLLNANHFKAILDNKSGINEYLNKKEFKNLENLVSHDSFKKLLSEKSKVIFPINTPESSCRINENAIKQTLENLNEYLDLKEDKLKEIKFIEEDYLSSGLMKIDDTNKTLKAEEKSINNEVFNHFIEKCREETPITKITERTNLCRRNKINCKEINSKTVASQIRELNTKTAKDKRAKKIEKKSKKNKEKIISSKRKESSLSNKNKEELNMLAETNDDETAFGIILQSKRKLSQISRKNSVIKIGSFEKINDEVIGDKSNTILTSPFEVFTKDKKDFQSYVIITKHNIYDKDNKNNMIISKTYYRFYFISGISANMIRLFSYLNSKIIGYSEYKEIFSDKYNLLFPDEFPSTLGSTINNYSDMIDNIEKYCLYPPSKRPNYQKLISPSPFSNNWGLVLLSEMRKRNPDSCVSHIELKTNYYDNESKENKEIKDYYNLDNTNLQPNIFLIENINDNNNCLLNKQLIKENSLNLKHLYLVPIFIESIEKGIPRTNTMICLPNKEELMEYLKYLKIKKDKPEEKSFTKKNIINTNSLFDLLDANKNNIEEKLNTYDFYSDFLNKKKKATYTEANYNTLTKNKNFKKEYITVSTENKEICESNNENTNTENKKVKAEMINKDFSIKVPKMKYDLIGYTTSGRFSFESTKGVGKGFISKDSIKDLAMINKQLREDNEELISSKYFDNSMIVLCRNPQSKVYFYAKLRTLNMNLI